MPHLDWLQVVLTISTVFSIGILPTLGSASGLKDTIKNLYGGDGILLAPPVAGFSHAPHFQVTSLQGLDNLSSALTSGLGVLALGSTVTGFTFDVERGVPVRTTESLGPLLAERAPTLGAGKLNVAFSYSRIDFKRLEGTRLNDLRLIFAHEDSNLDGRLGPPPAAFDFELDQIRVDLDLKIKQDVFAFFATYGLTRSWDVGLVLPLIRNRVRAVANATIVDNSPTTNLHFFDTAPGSDQPRSTGGGEKTGVGDLIVRSKYNFLRNSEAWPDLGILGQIKFPTGDQDNLLGTGETNFLALLIASRSFAAGGDIRWLTPHFNLGFEWSTRREENNLRYAVGLDARVLPTVSLATDVLGRWRPSGDGIGDHIVDIALGAKWNPLGTFVLNTGVQLPINRSEGLRPNIIWMVGLEYTF
ncbi:MAG TPA: hypothetical protein VFU31_17715 [Candidatus Binatia bacterium]|nr:hypothetical protein [Candidatus Binatia bacterium]